MTTELIARLRGKDPYIAIDVRIQAADALEAQAKRIAELEREIAEIHATGGTSYTRLEKAESALRECMAHADALCSSQGIGKAYNDAAMKYQEWRAKQ